MNPPPPRGRNTGALVRLFVAVVVIVLIFAALGLLPLLILIFSLIVIVMLHEFGHFVTAKWSHMKVSEFFVGFGPRLWSIRKGETEYGIKAIPAGGYVKIIGMTNTEEVDEIDEPRTYRQQPFYKRIIVACAGSAMHVLLALLLAYVAVMCFGQPSPQPKVIGFEHWNGVALTPAKVGKLRVGDVIEAVNGHPITNAHPLDTYVRHASGRRLTLTVDRNGATKHLTVVPRLGTEIGGVESVPPTHSTAPKVGLIGIKEGTYFRSVGPVVGIGDAFKNVGDYVTETAKALPSSMASLWHSVFSAKAARQSAKSGDRPLSLIGIGRISVQAEENGVYWFLGILVLVNISFAILNMVPMLPLDGGHVAIAVYERIRTRKGRPYYQADATKMLPVVYAFLGLLAVFVLAVMYLDIAYPLANPFH